MDLVALARHSHWGLLHTAPLSGLCSKALGIFWDASISKLLFITKKYAIIYMDS